MVQLVAELQELWEVHRAEVDANVATIEDAVGDLMAGALDDAERDLARRAAHQLAGTVGTFGFTDASDHARVLEEALQRRSTRQAAPRLTEVVASLRGALDDSQLEPTRSGRAPTVTDPLQSAQAVDVVVVEDDVVLSDLLLHTLELRGYSCCAIADGEQATQALTGSHPILKTTVVLLDWDLPGRNGLGVLCGLRDAGVLEGTRVIMLTLHSGEAESREMLDLGAFDHVAKPFSVPHLMERVHRAARGDATTNRSPR